MDSSSVIFSRGESAGWSISQTSALSNLSQSMDQMQDDVDAVLQYEGAWLRDSMVETALLTLLFGLFTVLTMVAAYILFSRGIKRKATVMMLVAVTVVWASTLAYWIAILVAAVETYVNLLDLTSHISDVTMKLQACLGSIPGLSDTTTSCVVHNPPMNYPVHHKAYGVKVITGDVALAFNMVIGDSIVWWRAWVLSPDNRLLRFTGVAMVFATAFVGAAYTPLIGAGDLLGGGVVTVVAGFVSLTSNVIATVHIGHKLWEHRRTILSYLRVSSPRTQVERTLALLIESGLLYSALWVVIVVYYSVNMAVDVESAGLRTTQGAQTFYDVVTGSLIALVGMYPALVIIVCAVDKSLHERSADDDIEARNTSIVFHAGPSSRRRETLSELLSVSSAYYTAEENTGKSSEDPTDEGGGNGGAAPHHSERAL